MYSSAVDRSSFPGCIRNRPIREKTVNAAGESANTRTRPDVDRVNYDGGAVTAAFDAGRSSPESAVDEGSTRVVCKVVFCQRSSCTCLHAANRAGL